MTIYDVKNSDDLQRLADERGIDINWTRPPWSIVSTLTEDHEAQDCAPGPDEEVLRMASRIAVRNVDPQYRGYTPFGDIA